jgi:hypothetical protein
MMTVLMTDTRFGITTEINARDRTGKSHIANGIFAKLVESDVTEAAMEVFLDNTDIGEVGYWTFRTLLETGKLTILRKLLGSKKLKCEPSQYGYMVKKAVSRGDEEALAFLIDNPSVVA